MDTAHMPTKLIPAVDDLLLKFKHAFRATQHYQPDGNHWNPSEVASGFPRTYRLIFQSDQFPSDRLLSALRTIPEVESIQASIITQAELPRSSFTRATALSSPYRTDSTYLREAYQFSKGHPEIVIAVLDTGFELDHHEIREALLPGKDFVSIIDGTKRFIGDYLDYDDTPEDEVGHGTHVTGIIADRGLQMPIGVVPQCHILPVKVLGALQQGPSLVGAGLVHNIDCGIKWAVDRGASIINMSLGLRHAGSDIPHRYVIRYALSKGITIVAATGNEGRQDRYYPGALPGIIALGAADGLGNISPLSTYVDHVTMQAPGVNIFSFFLQNIYTASSGTSQAAPFVSGVIGLLKSHALELGHHLRDDQIKYILKHTSDKISPRLKDLRAGFGSLNLLDAVKCLRYYLTKLLSYA